MHLKTFHGPPWPQTLGGRGVPLKGWIAIKFGTDIHIPVRMNRNRFDDPLDFSSPVRCLICPVRCIPITPIPMYFVFSVNEQIFAC